MLLSVAEKDTGRAGDSCPCPSTLEWLTGPPSPGERPGAKGCREWEGGWKLGAGRRGGVLGRAKHPLGSCPSLSPSPRDPPSICSQSQRGVLGEGSGTGFVGTDLGVTPGASWASVTPPGKWGYRWSLCRDNGPSHKAPGHPAPSPLVVLLVYFSPDCKPKTGRAEDGLAAP